MLRSAISFHFPGESPQTAHDISLESIRGNKVAIEINKKTNHQFILKLFFRDTRITKWEEKTKFPLPILFQQSISLLQNRSEERRVGKEKTTRHERPPKNR